MKIKFTSKFKKQYRKAPKKVRKAFERRLDLFIKDKRHPLLSNHSLSGKLRGYRSINVSGDWRALFKEFKNGELLFFEFLGKHSGLYK